MRRPIEVTVKALENAGVVLTFIGGIYVVFYAAVWLFEKYSAAFVAGGFLMGGVVLMIAAKLLKSMMLKHSY